MGIDHTDHTDHLSEVVEGFSWPSLRRTTQQEKKTTHTLEGLSEQQKLRKRNHRQKQAFTTSLTFADVG